MKIAVLKALRNSDGYDYYDITNYLTDIKISDWIDIDSDELFELKEYLKSTFKSDEFEWVIIQKPDCMQDTVCSLLSSAKEWYAENKQKQIDREEKIKAMTLKAAKTREANKLEREKKKLKELKKKYES